MKLLLEFPDALFHGVDKGSILGDDEVRSSQASWTGRKAITFDPTVGSRSNFYWSFRMPFSMERMRDRYSVMMRSVEPGLMDGLKGHNFRSDRWIAIKLLLEFPDALFHAVDEGSILGDDEVWSSQARWTGRKAITFDPTVGSRSNFYWSFRMPFSMQWKRDRYLVMMRSGRSRLDGQF